MKFKANWSTREEPFWYMDDNFGYRSVFPFAILKSTVSDESFTVISYGVIIGPLYVRVCFPKKKEVTK